MADPKVILWTSVKEMEYFSVNKRDGSKVEIG